MEAAARRARRALLGRVLAALAAFAGPALAQTSASPAPALSGPALVSALRAGGYVLYLRHTSTDFSQNDARMTDYADCSTQRNLTDQGRQEARDIAAALAALRIPVGPVLASPYCRTMESGRLAFGSATATPAVRGGPASAGDERYAELRRLLSTPVPRGSNLAIAGHGNPFRAVAGPPHLAEGEIAVIEPLGNGRFRVAARVARDGWTALLAAR